MLEFLRIGSLEYWRILEYSILSNNTSTIGTKCGTYSIDHNSFRGIMGAEFARTDHGLLVATLKIQLKFRKMAPSNRVRLDVRRLRDESVAQEYERELAESLGEPSDSDDPEKLWTDFKTKVLKVSESCLRGTFGTSKSFLDK